MQTDLDIHARRAIDRVSEFATGFVLAAQQQRAFFNGK